jgi:sterol desaturase/sphingolipid hydroxylase (fatty acid hydroxylase superfamily)
MSYERRLAFNLRSRGLSEPEVAEVIDELRAHQATAGTPAEAEFGTAEQYAKQFPKMKRRSRGQIIVTVGTILAIAYVLFAVLLALLFRVDIRDYVGPITLQPGLVLIVAAFVAGFLTDYFRPVQSSVKAR